MTIADDARDLVARTCAAQGLPEHVTDPTTLAKVAALITRNGNADPKAGVTHSLSTTTPTPEGGRRYG